jgi:hypothetical protein
MKVVQNCHPFFQQANPFREITEHIELLIETSGLDWTFLRPAIFAGNALHWWAQQISAGDVVRWPYLSAPTAPIDERDIAAVALRVLTEDDPLDRICFDRTSIDDPIGAAVYNWPGDKASASGRGDLSGGSA